MTKETEPSCFNKKESWRTTESLIDGSTGDMAGMESKTNLGQIIYFKNIPGKSL